MHDDTLRLVLLIALGVFIGASFLLGFLFPVSGRFVRADDPDDEEALELYSFGPFVRGRVEVAGGHREYSGLAVLGRGNLVRRDHGQKLLRQQGYPEAIAQRRDGEVAAKLKVVRRGGEGLDVLFSAARVEFTHRPPKVQSVAFLKPQLRRYVREG